MCALGTVTAEMELEGSGESSDLSMSLSCDRGDMVLVMVRLVPISIHMAC